MGSGSKPAPWGKCGYKILQYMGVGLPAVASSVGINSKFITHGVNGFLASGPPEWEHSLESLIRDASLRREMGAKGRQTIEDFYSLKQFSARYVHLMLKVAGG
ncbi:MAG: glycosyltransferase [Desulfobacteraceae bacterium]